MRIVIAAIVASIGSAGIARGAEPKDSLSGFVLSAEEYDKCKADSDAIKDCRYGSAKIEVELTRRLLTATEEAAAARDNWQRCEAQKKPLKGSKESHWPAALAGFGTGAVLAVLITLVAVGGH